MIEVYFLTQASSHAPAHRGVWKPLSVSRVWNVHRTCLLAVPLLFFLHRHDDVTPSWFRALESHVLHVPNGNGIKKWSSPSSLSSPSVLVWFVAAPRKQYSCLHLYSATTHRLCCARWVLAMEDDMFVKNLVCNRPAMWRVVKSEPMSRPSDNVPCPSSFMFPTISPNHPHWLTSGPRRRQKLPWPQNILPTNTRVWIVSSCQFCAST